MNDYLISDNDKQFADEFSRFVNGKMGSAAKTGREWANDHRFVVNEKFKVVMAFMEQLAENYKQGCYDLVMNGHASWRMKLSSTLEKRNFIIQFFKFYRYGKLGNNSI